MSEKRFEFYSDEYIIGVLDTVTGKTFNSLGIVDCLNEQQATINKQSNRIEELERILETNYVYSYDILKQIKGDDDE